MAEFAADLRRLGPAIFPYADSDVLFAHGHRRIQCSGVVAPPGLFLLSRRCSDADVPVHASGVAVGPGFREASLIASVPRTEDSWQTFAEGEIVVVAAGSVEDAAAVDATIVPGTGS